MLVIKHVGYSVRDIHYAIVGKTLIETLSLFFANRFTLEHRRIWTSTYETVAGVMMAAASARAAQEPMQQIGKAANPNVYTGAILVSKASVKDFG